MHLVFLYLGNFRCLKKVSFNFDLNYTFEVQDHKICLKSELKDTFDLSRFFSLNERNGRDKGCISNINAIVGPNGSGKTTLAFVLQQLAKGMPVSGDCIAIFKNDARDKDEKEFYCCSSIDKGRIEYELDERLQSRCGIGPFRLWRTMIYYSPIYSAVHPIVGEKGKVYDVSTTAQIRKMPSVNLKEGESNRGIKASAIYDTVETRSILELLNESKMKGFFSVMPVGLRIKPSQYALAIYQQDALAAQNQRVELDTLLENKEFDEDDEKRAVVFGRILSWAVNTGRLALAFALYANGVVRTSFDKSENLYYRRLAIFAKELYVFCKTKLMSSRNDKEVLASIDEFLKVEMSNNEDYNDWHRGTSLVGVIAGAKEVFNTIGNLPFSNYSDYKMGPLYLDFLMASSDGMPIADRILKLMSNHSESAMGMDYLEFTLDPPLSSGEASMLSMFGRVLNALRELRCTQASIFPVLIFLDEAETTLHPSVQRNLVYDFIRFCERCTEDTDVQIIFASHSPTLLSDIPKGNVCFLPCKNSGNDSQEEDITNLQNTFGANIFDLYRLAFNQKDGTAGSFATSKIQVLLDKVKNLLSNGRIKRTGYLFSKEDRKLIELIGDPLVSRYLRYMQAEAKRHGGAI